MRVLICGGRSYSDRDALCRRLDLIHTETPFSVVIHGGARGADRMAGEWAKSRGIPYEEYRANWEEHGNSAGPIRNQKMLDESKPELVIAFPGGTGTAHMVRIAQQANVPVKRIT